MKLNFKNPGVALIAILGGAALVYTFCLFVPGQMSLRATRDEIQSRQVYILQAAQAAVEVSQAEEKLAETAEYIAARRESMPTADGLAQAAGELTTCASQAGVRIVRFSPQAESSPLPLVRAPVQMTIEGSLEQIFDFAARLEALDAPVWCQQFQVAADGRQSEDVEAEFDLLVFAANIEKSG